MAGEFRVGTLVAGIRVELEDSAGIKQAQSQLRDLQTGAKQAGAQAGTAAGRGLSDGVVKGARTGGKQAGKALGDAAIPDARAAGDRAGAEFGKAAGGGIKKAAAGVGAAVAGMFAVGQAATWLRGAKDAASNLNETTSKTAAVFGTSAKAMDAWGDSAARSVGLSKQAALETSATFGDMFLQLKFGQGEATKMSQSVVQMAADFGSFNNLDTADVLDRISAGFRGEYDSIQALIPNINAARVEKEAMTASGVRNAQALTAQQKATAYLSILQKDGARAMGDFARTADGAANSEKVAAALAQDQAAAIGQKLLPAWTAFLQFLNNTAIPAMSGIADGLGGVIAVIGPMVSTIGSLASAFGSLPGPIQAALVAIAGARLAAGHMDFLTTRMAAAKAGVGGFSKDFGAAMSYAAQASQRAGGGFSGAAAGLRTFTGSAGAGAAAMGALKAGAGGLVAALGGPWGIALGAAAAAIGWLVSKHQEAAEATRKHEEFVKSLAGTLDESTGAITKQTMEMHAQQAATSGLADGLRDIGVNHKTLGQALGGNADSYELIRKRIDEVIDARQRAAAMAATDAGVPEGDIEGLKRLREQLDQQRGASGAAREEWQKGRDVLDGLTGATGKATDATKSKAEQDRAAQDAAKQHTDAMKELDSQLDAHANKIAGARGAQARYQATLAEVTKGIGGLSGAVTKNGEDFNLQSENGRKAQGMILDLGKAARDAALAQLDLGKGTDVANGQMVKARDAFLKAAESAGLNKTAAKKLADELGLTTQAVNTHAGALGKIPAGKSTKVTTPGIEAATTKVAEFVRKTLGLPPSKSVKFTADVSQALVAIDRLASVMRTIPSLAGFGTMAELGVRLSGYTGRAAGGAVSGPGSGTSDSIIVPGPGGMWGLSNGEHVLTAAEVAKLGGHGDVELLRALIRNGLVDQYTVQGLAQMRRRAAGGAVGSAFTGVDTSGLLGNLLAQLMGFDPAPRNEAAARVEDGFDRLADALKRMADDSAVAADKVKTASADLTSALGQTASSSKAAASSSTAAASATGRMVGALAAAPAQYRRLFQQAEAKYGVSANLLAAIAKKESGFNPRAVSPAGARGLMQFMPGTARGLGVNANDPASSIDGAARYIKAQLTKFGSIEKALAAYNAGPGNVQKYGGIPPFAETRNYVKTIMADPGVKGVIVGAATTAAVALKPKNQQQLLIEFGKALRAKGYAVSENKALGDNPRPGSHAPGGYHYRNNNSAAFDLNAEALVRKFGGTEKSWLNKAVADANRLGLGSIWQASDHYDHAHIDTGKRVIGSKGSGATGIALSGVVGGAGTAAAAPASSNSTTVAKARADLAASQAELAAAKKRQQVVEELLRAAVPVRKRLSELAVAEAAIKADMEEAAQAYDDAVKRQQEYADQVARSVVQNASLDKLFDASSEGTVPSAQSMLDYLDKAAQKAGEFEAKLAKLRDLDMRGSLLELIASKGPEAGAKMADAILEGGYSLVAQLNSKQLGLEQSAERLGKFEADLMYGAGTQTAKGVLDGLKTDHDAIVSEMTSMAVAFIAPMLDMLRGLGAKIPAEVMAQYTPVLNAVRNAPASKIAGNVDNPDRQRVRLEQTIKTEVPAQMVFTDYGGSFRGYVRAEASAAARQEIQQLQQLLQWRSS